MAEQIGTVEVLKLRNYAIDSESPQPRTEVIVAPGIFPLYKEGLSHFWLMTGTLNLGGVKRMGDGLFIQTPGDIPSDIKVTFPSRFMGPDEFNNLQLHPQATEGDPEQRIRIKLYG